MDDTADALIALLELQTRLDEDETKAKSWPCTDPDCGNLNHAFRARCNRCGTLRRSSLQANDPLDLWLAGARFVNNSGRQSEAEQCPICLTDMNEDGNTEGKPDGWAELISAWRETWITLLCGHCICSPCFVRYVEQYSRGSTTVQTMQQRGQTRNIRRYLCCLRCPREVGQEVVRTNTSEEVYANYLRATLRVALAGFGPLLTRCPGLNCDNAVLASNEHQDRCVMPVQCACGVTFCAGCGERWEDRHAILTCERFKLSTQTLEDVRAERWKERETKPCPSCHVPINKDNGCQHMTCRWCAHEFCWGCNADYTSMHACAGPPLPRVRAPPPPTAQPQRRRPVQWWQDNPIVYGSKPRVLEDEEEQEAQDGRPQRRPVYRTPRERYGDRPPVGPPAPPSEAPLRYIPVADADRRTPAARWAEHTMRVDNGQRTGRWSDAVNAAISARQDGAGTVATTRRRRWDDVTPAAPSIPPPGRPGWAVSQSAPGHTRRWDVPPPPIYVPPEERLRQLSYENTLGRARREPPAASTLAGLQRQEEPVQVRPPVASSAGYRFGVGTAERKRQQEREWELLRDERQETAAERGLRALAGGGGGGRQGGGSPPDDAPPRQRRSFIVA